VAFTCNHCPYAKAYEDRFSEFAKKYKDKGVELVAINVNNLEEDKLPAMKERAAEKGFTFAYLYDASQKIGRDFGAKTTPHLFVLDHDRKVRYIGLFDDNPLKAGDVKKRHVEDAVDALLKGEDPPVALTAPAGCSIKYE
jgi:thiol-disulfide isomerase/thioredoxin